MKHFLNREISAVSFSFLELSRNINKEVITMMKKIIVVISIVVIATFSISGVACAATKVRSPKIAQRNEYVTNSHTDRELYKAVYSVAGNLPSRYRKIAFATILRAAQIINPEDINAGVIQVIKSNPIFSKRSDLNDMQSVVDVLKLDLVVAKRGLSQRDGWKYFQSANYITLWDGNCRGKAHKVKNLAFFSLSKEELLSKVNGSDGSQNEKPVIKTENNNEKQASRDYDAEFRALGRALERKYDKRDSTPVQAPVSTPTEKNDSAQMSTSDDQKIELRKQLREPEDATTDAKLNELYIRYNISADQELPKTRIISPLVGENKSKLNINEDMKNLKKLAPKYSVSDIKYFMGTFMKVMSYDETKKLLAKFSSIYTVEDIKYWLAMTKAEAGNQGLFGKQAVANVIENRRRSTRHPNSIKAVVTARGQFDPWREGKITSKFLNQNFDEETIKAVTLAMQGIDITDGALFFYCERGTSRRNLAARRYINRIKIVDQWFHWDLTPRKNPKQYVKIAAKRSAVRANVIQRRANRARGRRIAMSPTNRARGRRIAMASPSQRQWRL